jgi:hypothetical protein
MTLLPQEDRAEFRRSVFAEYEPHGPTEEEIVEEMSRVMWRKQNLVTYRLAEEQGIDIQPFIAALALLHFSPC